MKDNYALLREVQQGFARIRAQQGTQSSTPLHKSLSDRVRAHFSEVLSKSATGLDAPEDDSEFAQRRLKQARQRSYTTTHDEDLEEPTEDTGAPAYPFGEGPLWTPGSWRVGPALDQFEALVGEAAERARIDSRTAPRRPRSRRSE